MLRTCALRKVAPACFTLVLLSACVSAAPPDRPAVAIAATSPQPSENTSVMSDAVPSGAFLFFEDFEKGTARWRLPDPTPNVGWRLLNAQTCGGAWTMLLGQAGHAPFTGPAGESLLELIPVIDLSNAVKPVLKYDVKGLATPEDALSVQAQVRPPDGDWVSLGHAAIGNHVFVGSVVSDLKPWTGKRIALRFKATFKQASQPSSGLYFDDVAVIEPN